MLSPTGRVALFRVGILHKTPNTNPRYFHSFHGSAELIQVQKWHLRDVCSSILKLVLPVSLILH